MDVVGTFTPLLVSLLILFVLSRLIVSGADEDRQAQETGNGSIEFTPNRRSYWGVYLFIAFMAYIALASLFTGIKGPMDLLPAFFSAGFILLLLAAFPGSLVADQQGLEQAYWLRGRKRIAWKDVTRIAVNEKKGEVRISGKGGTKVLHSRQLPDRARLIEELRKHCNEKLPADLAQKSVSS